MSVALRGITLCRLSRNKQSVFLLFTRVRTANPTRMTTRLELRGCRGGWLYGSGKRHVSVRFRCRLGMTFVCCFCRRGVAFVEMESRVELS